MTELITPGRWRGLQQTSTTAHKFNILAFDQRGTYRKMLPEGTSYERAAEIKREVVGLLSNEVSAVLLDHEYGMEAALHMNGHAGLLFALEKSGYSGGATNRDVDFIDGWTVAKIKRTGASAVKMLVYYNPDTGALAEETEGIVARIVAECHQYDLPLFLEPLAYSIDLTIARESAEFASTLQHIVTETARRLGALKPDVLKLEFPLNISVEQDQALWRTACEQISSVCPVPWVILSAGVDFEAFVPQVEIACRAGASGFLAGRAIWKESVTMSDDDRQQFIKTVAVDRARRLTELAAQYARPWTDFYTPIPASDTWYTSYESI